MGTVDVGGRVLTVLSHAECPELEDAAQTDAFLRQWPTFMFHDATAAEHYPTMFGRYPAFQFYVRNVVGTVVASGNSIPLTWNGTPADLPTGWDDALARGALGVLGGAEPNTLCAIQATISEDFQGQVLGADPWRSCADLPSTPVSMR